VKKSFETLKTEFRKAETYYICSPIADYFFRAEFTIDTLRRYTALKKPYLLERWDCPTAIALHVNCIGRLQQI